MKRFVLPLLSLALLVVSAQWVGAQDATAILDKAIKAHGGEEVLGKIKAYSAAAKAKLIIFGMEHESEITLTAKGLDHLRQEFRGEVNGNQIDAVTILAGDKFYSQFNGQEPPLNEEMIESTKRGAYINAVLMTLVPLKDKEFKLELAGEDKVGDKAVVGLKVSSPKSKEFHVYFDKESGLVAKVTIDGVLGFTGEKQKQDMLLTGYKEVNGAKVAMKMETLRNGEKMMEQEVTEFKVLDKVDDETFAEPK
jgi:hypothetical protein